jgi:hypothetical protein
MKKTGQTSKMDIKRALDILPKEKIIVPVLNQRPVERARSRAYGS